VDKQEERHLRHVRQLAEEYLATINPIEFRRHRADRWAHKIEDWATKNGKAQAADFVSRRDRKPYVISSSDGVHAAVGERVGKRRRRYIVDEGGQFKIFDEGEIVHMNRAKGLASQYAASPEGRKGPLTAEAVRKWVIGNKKGTAKDLESTRDHKPYILRRDVLGVAVLEAKGEGDSRYMSTMAGTGPATEEQIRRMFPTSPATKTSESGKAAK
jgi:hypothetical protein